MMLTLFAAGLVALLAFNVADLITTQRVLNRGGKESNPVLAAIMGFAGPAWRVVKMGLAMAAIVILWMIGPGLWSWATLGLLNAAWVYVVWHNATVLRGMKD